MDPRDRAADHRADIVEYNPRRDFSDFIATVGLVKEIAGIMLKTNR